MQINQNMTPVMGDKLETDALNITRTIEFSGCFDRTESHVSMLEIDTYYYCDRCRLYRKISSVC